MPRLRPATAPFLAVLALAAAAAAQPAVRVLDAKLHHLGDSNLPAWEPEVPQDPEGTRLDLTFEAQPNEVEYVLSAVGRIPNTEDVGLDKAGVATTEDGGFVAVDDAMRTMIHDGAGEFELEQQARKHSPGIRQDGWRNVLDGMTSVEEVLRVTQGD